MVLDYEKVEGVKTDASVALGTNFNFPIKNECRSLLCFMFKRECALPGISSLRVTCNINKIIIS